MEKFGLSSAGLWKILSTFERENPQEAALMKRQGKEMTPEDYKELQRELSRLKKELERELCVRVRIMPQRGDDLVQALLK